MNFRDLMTKLDNINNGMLAEGLTLSAIIAVTSGYEQDDKVRIPKLAQLAKENSLEGLVDPVTGNYVSSEGEVDDEVPFEIAQKLSAAGLLPKNARLPQAGWFDNEDTFKKANADLVNQSSKISGDADALHDKIKQMMDLFNKILELRKKRADAKLAANSLGSPGANAAASTAITPPNIASTLNNMQTSLKDASAGMADPGNITKMANDAITKGMALQNAPTAIKESYGMANALLDSFGYEQLNEDLSSDIGDTARGAWNTATWGTGNNINAGVKSLFKGTKYKDELAGELAAEKEAEARSPKLYTAGQIAGAFAPIPGAGIGAAAKGAKGIGGFAHNAAATLGKSYAIGQGVDAANAYTLGSEHTPVGPHPAGNSGSPNLAKLQQIVGTKPDGIMGPKTQAAVAAWQQKNGLPVTGVADTATLAKAGLREGSEMKQTNVEQMSSLRDLLAQIEEGRADILGKLLPGADDLSKAIFAPGAKAVEKNTLPAVSGGRMSAADKTSIPSDFNASIGNGIKMAPGAEKAVAGNTLPAVSGGRMSAADKTSIPSDFNASIGNGIKMPGGSAAQAGMDVNALGKSKNFNFAGAAADAEQAAAQGGMDVGKLGNSKNFNFAGAGRAAGGAERAAGGAERAAGGAERGGKGRAAVAGLALGAAGMAAWDAYHNGQGPKPPGPDPKPHIHKPHPHPVHKQGNPEIMKWQELLNANGEHLKVDGIYGPETQAAYDRVFPKFQPDPKFPGTNAAPVAESIRALSTRLSLIESGLDPEFMDQLANEGLADIAKGAWNAGKNLIGGMKGRGPAPAVTPMLPNAADKLANRAGKVAHNNPKSTSFLGGLGAGAAGMAAWDAYHNGQGPKPEPIHDPKPHIHHPHIGGGGGGGGTTPVTPPTPPTPPVTPAVDPTDAEMAALMAQLKIMMADVAKSSNPEAQKAVADMTTRLNGVQ